MPAGTRSAAEAAGGTSVRLLGRLGLIGYGVVNLLLAWLTVQVAFGAGEQEAEAGKGGAVQHLAESPWGAAGLWVIGIGLLALALWQLAEAIRGREAGTLRRVLSVAEAVAFVALGVSAVRAAAGRGSGGSNEEQAGFTARVLEAPGGPVWVALAGVLVIGWQATSLWGLLMVVIVVDSVLFLALLAISVRRLQLPVPSGEQPPETVV